jgi:uncharacterized membrane protein YphA (DoxX/SURF4 family)
MTLQQLWTAWNDFWFAYGSPIPIALFRICIGLLVITFYWWISPEAVTFFGQHAITRPATVAAWSLSPTFDVLSYFPRDDVWLSGMLVLLVVCGICLTAGIFSRFSAFLIYLILLSLDSRNHFVLNSGIGILCYLCLFLVFSKCGEALSLKRLVAVWQRNPEFGPAKDVSVFAQRLVQVQLCLVYWAASCWKLNGHTWLDGTAIFYTTQLLQFQRFGLPYVFDHLWTSRLLTWATLFFEAGFPILVWIKEFRYPLLVIGVIFHLGMDWVLVIPLFQEVMIACYICFVEAADLSKAMTAVRQFASGLVSAPLKVSYDGANNLSCRLAEMVRRLDILGLLEFSNSEGVSGLLVESKGGSLQGLQALRRLAVRLPLLMPVAIIFWLPGFQFVFSKCSSVLGRIYSN